MTRYLGADGYGIFVALLAISSFFVPLAGLGLHGVLLREGARNPMNLSKLLGDALALWWPSTLLFSLIAVLIALWVSPISLPIALLAIFLFTEIAANSLVDLTGRLEQSQQRTRVFGALQAGLPLSRIAALLLFAALGQPETQDWIVGYTGASLAFTVAVLVWITQRYHPIFPAQRNWHMAGDGFPFSIGGLSLRLQAEFNKPILAQLGHAQVGNFSAAQRVVDLASLPLMAMQEVLWPRYFASTRATHQVWQTSLFLIAAALLCSLLLAISAPLLPLVLGSGFEHSATLLLFLAWLPPLQTLRNLMNASIVAHNRQSHLIWMYVICGLASILLNSVLIAKIGYAGAIWSSYLVELIAILVLIFQLLRYRRAKYVSGPI
jgi:O-antigen/teichoic acid export membrane protein